MDKKLENIKREIKSSNLLLRSTLVMLIFALGITYAGQINDDFEVSLGKKDNSLYSTRVDEADLYAIYKNQVALLGTPVHNKKFIKGNNDLAMQKRLVRAKQKRVPTQDKVFQRR